MKILESEIEPGNIIANIAQMLERNVRLFGDKIVYSERKNGNYEGITWN